MLLPVVNPQLHIELKVQECDARMLNSNSMGGNKSIFKKL
jgi:hypothetical protein